MLKKIQNFPKTHIFAAGSLSVALGAVLLLSPSTEVEANRISIPVPIEAGPASEEAPAGAVPVLAYTLPGPAAGTASSDTAATISQALASDDPEPALTDEQATQDIQVDTAFEKAPHQELIEQAESPALASDEWQSYKVRSGDSLSTIFKRAGYSHNDLTKVLAADKDKHLRHIYPGNVLEFSAQDGKLAKMRLKKNQLESILISRQDDGSFQAQKIVLTPEAHPAFGAGTITSSLYVAGQQAGLSESLIMEMANIFGYDIDFALDLRSGDRFNVVYEELYLDGQKIGYGNILAASFTNQGRTYTAVRYTDSQGRTSYYRPDGKSLRKAFIRTPVDFARISSHFNLNRRHPILNKIRAHKGTDYAAPPGTPIKAAGDGKVIFAGVKGGYGNVVIIQHGQAITTFYAHMQKFAKNIRAGARVDQGQIIGYVGSSGLATGPHLHYEFRVNDVPKNPATVKLPEAAPVPQKELARFKQHTSVYLTQLETFMATHQLALKDQ